MSDHSNIKMTSFYDAVTFTYLNGLNNLEHILSKGEAFTKEKGIPEEEVMQWRHAEDMLPFTFQVQTICNGAKNFVTRVTGAELPKVEDNEKTFAELHARIASTVDMIKSVKPEQLEGKESSEVVLTIRGGEYKFSGSSYFQGFAVPNLYFHITTLYLLFRSHGAPLGKVDFLRGGSWEEST